MASQADESTPLVSTADHPTDEAQQYQTSGRRFASFASKFSFYNPQGCDTAEALVQNPKTPSLEKAWKYFEHSTLARHFLPKEGSSKLQRAEPGESVHPTKLYSFWKTPENDLSDFGIGVGVYFYTLRCFAYIMFLAGVISIPVLWHFAGGQYNGDEDLPDQDARFWALRGSAICTDESWAACPTCESHYWTDAFPSTFNRYAQVSNENGTVLKFIKINNCNFHPRFAFWVYVALWFVIIAIAVLRYYSKQKEIIFDDKAQTSSDYTVQVTNPPKNAYDADEWKEFFSQFGHVVCCTVAVDNEDLVKALMKRRAMLLQLQDLQPLEEDFDPRSRNLDRAVEMAHPLSVYQKLTMSSDAPTLAKEIKKLEDTIQHDLANRQYDVSSVFITFETEFVQQMTLQTLAASGMDLFRNNTNALEDSNYIFRGEQLLRVIEPTEPSSVRWEDLDETPLQMFFQRLLTGLLSFVFIIGGTVVVGYARYKYGPVEAAISVTAINTIIPRIMSYLVSIEAHPTEGSRQASKYRKITASMFVNTTLVTGLITPFGDTIANDAEALLPAVYAIFFTELLRTPVTNVADIPGNVYRHYFGPRAPDQRRMNLYFTGSPYEISERYTNMTNMIFLTFWYSAIFPAGFFLATAVFVVHYYSDKFCLLRIWAPGPMVGNKIAEFARNYFFTGAVIVFSIITSYNFAGFPFDNACRLKDTTVSSDYVGKFVATDLNGTSVNVTIAQDDITYAYCNQDMLRYAPPAFPAIPANQPLGGEWMSEDQQLICQIFGWTSVFVTIGGLLVMFRRTILRKIKAVFVNPFEARHSTMQERFSDVLDIFAYIPQIRIPGYPYPTLFCDVSKIGDTLVPWRDPDHPFEFHNAIYDLPIYDENSDTPIFSTVHHWSPDVEE